MCDDEPVTNEELVRENQRQAEDLRRQQEAFDRALAKADELRALARNQKRSLLCQVCNGPKNYKDAFCVKHYGSLPERLRHGTWASDGGIDIKGWVRAYKWLKSN
jgi:hypothetical protein